MKCRVSCLHWYAAIRHFANIDLMFYVYILQSQADGYLYVGYSTNLKRRLREHLNHKVHSTAKLTQLELIHYEAYKSSLDAHRRELYLKTTQGKRMLKIMLRESMLKIKKSKYTI